MRVLRVRGVVVCIPVGAMVASCWRRRIEKGVKLLARRKRLEVERVD
jgi:hypothetical protein